MARNDGANHTFVRNRDLKADKKPRPRARTLTTNAEKSRIPIRISFPNGRQ